LSQAAKKPLAALTKAVNKRVSVRLKSDLEYKGRMSNVDQYMNLILVDAEEYNSGILSTNYGKVLIRGNNVISIDYGIMEKFPSILVLPANFIWSDLGSFEALKAVLRKDSKGNVKARNSILVGSEDCLVKNETKKVIGLVGLENVGVIETEDALLVCDLKQSQKVKDLVGKLKGDSRFKHLV